MGKRNKKHDWSRSWKESLCGDLYQDCHKCGAVRFQGEEPQGGNMSEPIDTCK